MVSSVFMLIIIDRSFAFCLSERLDVLHTGCYQVVLVGTLTGVQGNVLFKVLVALSTVK